MGFDPRHWPSASAQPRRVTTNLDALLAENEALRREVQQLRRQLEQLKGPAARPTGTRSASNRSAKASAAPPPRVTPAQVQRWGDALASQSGWRELRLGEVDGGGLQGVLDDLNRRSFQPGLSLEQRLDRLVPELGRDLQKALAGPPSRRRLAILAAFALYGASASEWLDDAPQRVVAELRQRQTAVNPGGGRSHRRRTSSDHRSQERQQSQHSQHSQQKQNSQAAPSDADPRRLEAYRLLGLAWGASRQAIKAAHRKLVKRHHPDMGGRAEDFQRISDAYQLLLE